MKNFYTYCIYGMNNGNFSFPIPILHLFILHFPGCANFP